MTAGPEVTGTGGSTSAAVVALSRENPMPLWAQLESELQRRLEAGDFDEGFPTDAELCELYDVSRHTVRQAVEALNKTGVLRRGRGQRTVVVRSEFQQTLGTLYSLFQSVESEGVLQTSEVLRLDTVKDPIAAVQLEVAEDADLVLLERVRFAAGSPLAVDRAWLPHDVAAPLLDVDFTHTALYDELDLIGDFRPTGGWERLTPMVPPAADRRLLGLGPTDAAFFLERLGRCSSRPIEWRTTMIRGDRFRFVADWATGTEGVLRPVAAS